MAPPPRLILDSMTRIEPRDVPLEDFPESTASSERMDVLEVTPTPRYPHVHLGVEYARHDDQPRHLHVITPPQPDGTHLDPASDPRYPTIVFVQGSAWRVQELGSNLAGLADFARRGYVIALVEYRPSDIAPFPAQVEDAVAAVAFLRAHAAPFNVDPERMAMWGDSSGGHTTLMAHVRPDLGLRCCVDFYGPTDISRMNDEPSALDHTAPDSPEGMLIGGFDVAENPDKVAPTVVMAHIPDAAERPLPPLLVVHGSKDRLVPFAQSVLLVDKFTAAGQDVRFVQLKGADHGGHAFWQPEVDLVDAFLAEHLADAP